MKEIRHSFFIRSAPETITAALLHDEHMQTCLLRRRSV